MVDTPDQRVHKGVDAATQLYTQVQNSFSLHTELPIHDACPSMYLMCVCGVVQWEARQGEAKQDEAPALRLPPRFLALQPDEHVAGEEEGGGEMEESQGQGKKRRGRRPTQSTAQAYPHGQALTHMLTPLPNHSHLTQQLQHTLVSLRPHLRTAE